MGNIAKFTLAISKGLDWFNSIPPAAIQVRSDPIRLPTGRPVKRSSRRAGLVQSRLHGGSNLRLDHCLG